MGLVVRNSDHKADLLQLQLSAVDDSIAMSCNIWCMAKGFFGALECKSQQQFREDVCG